MSQMSCWCHLWMSCSVIVNTAANYVTLWIKTKNDVAPGKMTFPHQKVALDWRPFSFHSSTEGFYSWYGSLRCKIVVWDHWSLTEIRKARPPHKKIEHVLLGLTMVNYKIIVFSWTVFIDLSDDTQKHVRDGLTAWQQFYIYKSPIFYISSLH